ncbi:LysR substrate-binding domain-containing protein [Citricoccus sp. NPDC055426]|uniref:LysR family transcriptional regulator n=1 Tax=Citricoccus sp. NPDC055426 TaxID=3155536 RepID=UPI003430CFBC
MTQFDLNLLPTLQVLLEVRNVSKAADRMERSQPATSAALAKLRRYFDDDLLVRVGRTYELTPFAQSLVPLVDEAIVHTQRATEGRSGFDPATSERTFIIAASDYASTLVIGALRHLLRGEAPGVQVDFVPNGGLRGVLSDFARIDLLIGPPEYQFEGSSRHLFRDSFVAIVDQENPLLQRDRLMLADLLDAPHAVGFFGDDIRTPADLLFDHRGLKPREVAILAGFLPLPQVVEGTDLLALLPRMLAARAQRGTDLGMLVFDEEIEPSLVETMFWHPSKSGDPASQWLRSVVQRACADLHQTFAGRPHGVTIGAPDGT